MYKYKEIGVSSECDFLPLFLDYDYSHIDMILQVNDFLIKKSCSSLSLAFYLLCLIYIQDFYDRDIDFVSIIYL